MKAGPNLSKLAAHKLSVDAIPKGGDFMDGVNLLLDKDRLAQSAREAMAWAREAVRLIRQAAEPNPWKSATDEEIAGELLRQIQAKKRKPVSHDAG